MDFEVFCEWIVESGLAAKNEIAGCTENEIAAITQCVGTSLPQVYIEFLNVLGKSCGNFLQGTDIFCDAILEIQDWALELVNEENKPDILPENSFILFMHQGYQFGYFLLDNKANPPIYFFSEGMKAPEKKWKSLEEFFLTVLHDMKNAA